MCIAGSIRVWILLLGVSLSINHARADFFEQEMFGHKVSITKANEREYLVIDNRPFLDNTYISLSSVSNVNGTPVVIGESSTGGNACEASPFVLSFPPGGQPRLDGPLSTCSYATVTTTAEGLLFETRAVPGSNGKRWSWTPTGGFKTLAEVPLAIQSDDGWARLRERNVQHPADLVSYGVIGQQMTRMLGREKKAYEQIIAGVGSGEFIGDDYLGTTCAPHSCGDVEALIFLDASVRAVYLAWKPRGQKIIVRPAVQQWPEKAKVQLRQWASTWN